MSFEGINTSFSAPLSHDDKIPHEHPTCFYEGHCEYCDMIIQKQQEKYGTGVQRFCKCSGINAETIQIPINSDDRLVFTCVYCKFMERMNSDSFYEFCNANAGRCQTINL